MEDEDNQQHNKPLKAWCRNCDRRIKYKYSLGKFTDGRGRIKCLLAPYPLKGHFPVIDRRHTNNQRWVKKNVSNEAGTQGGS